MQLWFEHLGMVGSPQPIPEGSLNLQLQWEAHPVLGKPRGVAPDALAFPGASLRAALFNRSQKLRLLLVWCKTQPRTDGKLEVVVSPAPSQDRAFSAAAVPWSRAFSLHQGRHSLCSWSRTHGRSHGKSFRELRKELGSGLCQVG